MKKILIIGSQGYLGSRLVEYLDPNLYECHCVDVGFFNYGVLYYPSKDNWLYKSASNISDNDLKGFDVVLMLAGVSNDPLFKMDPKKIYDPTRDYALAIAKRCKALGVRYIFPSSCSVYGVADKLSNENSSLNPQTHYSTNKVEIEKGLTDLADADFSPIALRFATVFGLSPRMRFDLVVNMLCGMAITTGEIILNSNGEAWRPHVDIEDVCQSFKCAIDYDYSGGDLLVYNIGHLENNRKIVSVAEVISSITDAPVKFLSDEVGQNYELVKDRKINNGVDTRTYSVDFSKAHNELPGFTAKVGVEDGIRNLLQSLKKYELTECKFKQIDFYRLQQLEHLDRTAQLKNQLS